MNIDAPAPENDPGAVVDAMRGLIEIAIAEDSTLIKRLGYWPDEFRAPTPAAAIQHPLAFACRHSARLLVFHLAKLIGEETAEAQFVALIAEQGIDPAVRAAHEKVERSSGKPAPSTLRSVH